MDDIIKIGKVNSPKDDNVRYQIGLHTISGTVHIEIEHSGLVSWLQVGENINVNSPNKTQDALNVASDFLTTNDIFNFKRYQPC